MKRIFTYINNMTLFSKLCLICPMLIATLLLIALIPLKFYVFQSHTFLFFARYTISVAAALFCEGLVFSCIVHNKIKEK